ncbi:MAG: hypothetical protein ABSF00_04835 [Candidatus Bathyarchaeia archaeon]|jgi:hypothetical protein
MEEREKKEDSCCHDYDEAWVCRICGYQLPVAIQNKIRRIGEGERK